VLASDAEQKLLRYSWPGNARELSNIVQRAAWLATGGEITAAALDIGAAEAAAGSGAIGSADAAPFDALGIEAESDTGPGREMPGSDLLGRDLKERERELILATLRITAGSRKLAAERLGISPRTLRHKLQQLKAAGVRVPGLHDLRFATA
jgi:two-component system response regulator FlrC